MISDVATLNRAAATVRERFLGLHGNTGGTAPLRSRLGNTGGTASLRARDRNGPLASARALNDSLPHSRGADVSSRREDVPETAD